MTDLREAVAAAWFESSALGKSVGFGHAPEAAKREIRGLMDKLFKAIEAAGYAVVKKEPTEAMQIAGSMAADNPPPWNGTDVRPVTAHVYRAMLSAGDLLGEKGL